MSKNGAHTHLTGSSAPQNPDGSFPTSIQGRPHVTPDQLHYLSNDVYKTARTARTRKLESDYSNRPTSGRATGAHIPIPGNPNHEIHESRQIGISDANPTLGINKPYLIIIDHDILDKITTELTDTEYTHWTEALETDTPRRTLWTPNWSKNKLYWRANAHLPAAAPTAGLKITQRLAEYLLVWEATPEQHALIQAARGERGPTMLETVQRALQCA